MTPKQLKLKKKKSSTVSLQVCCAFYFCCSPEDGDILHVFFQKTLDGLHYVCREIPLLIPQCLVSLEQGQLCSLCLSNSQDSNNTRFAFLGFNSVFANNMKSNLMFQAHSNSRWHGFELKCFLSPFSIVLLLAGTKNMVKKRCWAVLQLPGTLTRNEK